MDLSGGKLEGPLTKIKELGIVERQKLVGLRQKLVGLRQKL
jgi:hypothetical protein